MLRHFLRNDCANLICSGRPQIEFSLINLGVPVDLDLVFICKCGDQMRLQILGQIGAVELLAHECEVAEVHHRLARSGLEKVLLFDNLGNG